LKIGTTNLKEEISEWDCEKFWTAKIKLR
jgi:hypothetical protein